MGHRQVTAYPGHGESAFRVLYEDNHVIGVFKPIGIPCQQGRDGIPTILDITKAHLKEKYNKPGNVFVGLVHRLDQPVSGVLLLAKTSKGASRLSEQFRTRSVEKTYRAWVQGVPSVIQQKLEREALGGEKSMSLTFSVHKKKAAHALIEIALGTGRKHQIREQMAEFGHPIVGDVRFGAKPMNRGEILLVSRRLEFDHPTQKTRLVLELPDELDLVTLTDLE